MRYVRFSPYVFLVALTPVFLQTSTPVSCTSGDTTLSEFAVIVDGEDQIVGFDPAQLSYAVSLPVGTDEALVHAVSTDPEARVWVDILVDDERLRYQHGGLGGGDLTVPLPKGASTLEVWVRPPGGATDFYTVAIEVGLPCTEDALREAVATGGGPYVFDCDEPIVTASTIHIGRDVMLDGLGTLVVSGGGTHRVFWVHSATVELRGMAIQEGGGPWQGSALNNNRGNVTIVDSTISDNYRGGISSHGSLTVVNSLITRNTDAWGGGGIAVSGGSATITDSVVSDNTSEWYGGIGIVGANTSVVIVRTLVTGNESTLYGNAGIGVATENELTVIDSTISYNRSAQHVGGIGGSFAAKISVIGSAIVGNEAAGNTGGVGTDLGGTLYIVNSTVSGNHTAAQGGGIWIGPGGTADVVNTTVMGNAAETAATGVGGFGVMNVRGSIVVGDCAFFGPDAPVFTNTLEGTPTGASSESSCLGSTVVPESDLGLGPLQDNGGPTETHALSVGSVAIDVLSEAECLDAEGAPLTTDQRGEPRDSMCDAGAFELGGGISNVERIQLDWASSAHGDDTSLSWRHFDGDGAVARLCARCHAPQANPPDAGPVPPDTGFLEYLATGRNAGDAPLPVSLDCVNCHQSLPTIYSNLAKFGSPDGVLEPVRFPSGDTATLLGPSNICMSCHQGRTSKAFVDDAFINSVVQSPTDYESYDFINIHYYVAAATFFGTEAQGGYEYAGEVYRGRNTFGPSHDPTADGRHLVDCVGCHMNAAADLGHRGRHTFMPEVEDCAGCHTGDRFDELEGAPGENFEAISLLKQDLLAAIRDYATSGLPQESGVVYVGAQYPFWFSEGAPPFYPNRYRDFDFEMLTAAYNYQVAEKDPAGYIHNGAYVQQLLFDSICALGGTPSIARVPDRPASCP